MSSFDYRPIDESRRGEFEAAWLSGQPDAIEECLPQADDETYQATLEELVFIDMEFAWKRAGSRQSETVREMRPENVESYLARFPELNEQPSLCRLLRHEFLVRRQYGDSPAIDEYRQRFGTMIDDQTLTDTLLSDFPEPDDGDGRSAVVGEHLDRYELVEEQGEGYFGTVWKAHDPKMGRVVAIKQLKSKASANPELVRRFEAEARIAARLEHPGIVPVYETGGAEPNPPFYTMRLVDGRTLAEMIDEHHSAAPDSPGRRVGQTNMIHTFLAICRTVQYAHSQDVLHRDLKPHNVIVGQFGETILIDWGLAKRGRGDDRPVVVTAETEEPPQDPQTTRPGSLMGTPAYMSPEQAGGDTDRIGPRSDIYALGVVLFQILTGRLPYEADHVDQMMRRIGEGGAPSPRDMDGHIGRQISAICSKAMAHDSRERYAAVDAMVDDLEHYLADEPVSAYREPLGARLARWTRRHRTLMTGCVTATVVTLVAIAIGLALVTSAYRREATARQVAVRQRLRAEKSLSVALSSVDTFLVRFTTDVRLRAADMQEMRSEMLSEAGTFYDQLAGQDADSLALNRQKIHALRQAAHVHQELGKHDKGVDDLTSALEWSGRLVRLHPTDPSVSLDQAGLLSDLGNLYLKQSRLDLAATTLQRAIQTYDGLSGAEQRTDATEGSLVARGNLAVAYENQGEFPRAEQVYRESIEHFERLAKRFPRSIDVQRSLASSHNNLSSLLVRSRSNDQLHEAAEELQMALKLMSLVEAREPTDIDHPAQIAMLHNNLGRVYRRMAVEDSTMWDPAVDEYQEAALTQIELVERQPKVPEHQHKLAATYGNLSSLYYLRHDLDQAEQAVGKALKTRSTPPIASSMLPLYRYAHAGDYFTLSNVLLARDKLPAAKDALAQAAERLEPIVLQYPRNVAYLNLMAKIYHGRGHVALIMDRGADAVQWLTKSIGLLETMRGDTPGFREPQSLLADACELRAQARLLTKDLDGANADWNRAIALADPVQTPRIEFDQATSLIDAQQYESAERVADAMADRALKQMADQATRGYNAVRVFGMLLKSESQVPSGESTDVEHVSQRRVQRAMSVLAALDAVGALADPNIRRHLMTASEFESLRERPEFRKFAQDHLR